MKLKKYYIYNYSCNSSCNKDKDRNKVKIKVEIRSCEVLLIYLYNKNNLIKYNII